MDVILIYVIIIAASLAFYYTLKARHHRQEQNPNLMMFYSAKSKTSLGIMLTCMSIIQLFTHPDASWVRTIVGLVFLLYGAFLLYMGIKRYRYYLPKAKEEAKAA